MRRQADVDDDSTGLRFAPFPTSEWVAQHKGLADDTEEERSELGKGAFGTTYRMSNDAGLLVAAKRFSRRDVLRAGLTEETVLREAAMLRRLQHRHVVRYLGTVQARRHLLLVMELAPGGSLADRVLRRPPPEPADAERWAGELAAALEYVHWRDMLHRDIKAANVLLAAEGRALLADFGLSCVVSSSAASHRASRVGTSTYFSPERGRGETYGRAADMWALGCVVAEVLTGQLLAGPIWHDDEEVTSKREELLSKAAARCRTCEIYTALVLEHRIVFRLYSPLSTLWVRCTPG